MRRREATAAVLVGVVATVAVATTFRREPDRPRETQAAQRTVAWQALPPLSTGRAIDIDGAAIAAAGNELYAAVIDRAASPAEPSHVQTFRLNGGKWTTLGRIPMNRDAPFYLTGGERPCITATRLHSVRVWCLSRWDRRWRRSGDTVFHSTYPGPGVTLAGSFMSRGRQYVLRAEARRVSDGVRTEHRVFARAGSRWREPAPGDIDRTAPMGSQRVSGVTYEGRPCLIYDALSDNPAQGPRVQLRCLRRKAWQTAATGPLSLDDVSRSVQRGREAINTDGAAVVNDRLFVGIDHFQATQVRWRVYRASERQWTDSGFTRVQEAGWNSQGSLHAIGEQLWAVRFDQRPGPKGLRTRIVVLRQTPRGRVEQVGAPLLANAPFYGPLYWGLATAGGHVYAAATVPVAGTRRNEFRIFALSRPRSRPAP